MHIYASAAYPHHAQLYTTQGMNHDKSFMQFSNISSVKMLMFMTQLLYLFISNTSLSTRLCGNYFKWFIVSGVHFNRIWVVLM